VWRPTSPTSDGARLLICGDHGLASRAVLAWRLSNTIDAGFCVEALEEALLRMDANFQHDQGAQFTSAAFTGNSKPRESRFDGRARPFMDNIFIERLWRSIKYEESI